MMVVLISFKRKTEQRKYFMAANKSPPITEQAFLKEASREMARDLAIGLHKERIPYLII